MGQTSCPAERALSDSVGRQGLGVFAILGRCEAESVVLAGTEDRSGIETGDTVAAGNRVYFDHKAETEAAAADAGQADSVPKVWSVLLLTAVLAEVEAAEAGQWVWLGGTESESAVGSWSKTWSYQCLELSASDNSDTTTPGPEDRKQTGLILDFSPWKNISHIISITCFSNWGIHIYSILNKILKLKTVPTC